MLFTGLARVHAIFHKALGQQPFGKSMLNSVVYSKSARPEQRDQNVHGQKCAQHVSLILNCSGITTFYAFAQCGCAA